MTDTPLYVDDIVTWAEQQVAELRRLAENAPSNSVDWDNVIEEIESLGRSEWKGVESHIRNTFAHILKAFCDPDCLSMEAWRVEVDRFMLDAREDYRASMHGLIDLDRAWRNGMRLASIELRSYRVGIPPGLPATCPFTLDEVLDEAFTLDTGAGRLHRMARDRPA